MFHERGRLKPYLPIFKLFNKPNLLELKGLALKLLG